MSWKSLHNLHWKLFLVNDFASSNSSVKERTNLVRASHDSQVENRKGIFGDVEWWWPEQTEDYRWVPSNIDVWRGGVGRWGGYKCAGLLQVVQYIKKRKFERQKMFVNIVLVCATQKVKKCTISRFQIVYLGDFDWLLKKNNALNRFFG